jgi:triacylglycerol lipase
MKRGDVKVSTPRGQSTVALGQCRATVAAAIPTSGRAPSRAREREVTMKRLWLVVGCAWWIGCSWAVGATHPGGTPDALTPYTATQYPIVLVPGLLGFRTLLGAVDYFTAIPEALEESGAQVFVVDISPANTPEVRGKQLLAQLDALRTMTGAARFNLVAHSQGALDARWVADTRPDLVASVTSIGGPHLGSPVAQFAIDLPLGLGTNTMQALSDLVKLASGTSNANDATAALQALTPSGAAAFAAAHPAAMPTSACGSGAPVVGGIHYYSWGGIGSLTNPLDLLDPTWLLLGILDPVEGNDGLIPRCSTHLGEVIRDNYLANHTDETNLIFGLVSLFGPNPKTLYRTHANRLRNAGL